MFQKLRDCIEKFYPSEPLTISFSRFRFIVFILLILTASSYLYLRTQNKSELEILEKKHKEIQFAVRGYLNNMTRINSDDPKINEARARLAGYKKQLVEVEEKINSIKNFWLLE